VPHWLTLVWIAAGFAAWVLLMRVVLPRAGVPT
jgi:hypothetical protein